MCGTETFTTVVSSTSMNVASMTAAVTIHGLIGLGEAEDIAESEENFRNFTAENR